ncbi:MAG: hypothetical protein ABIP91_09315 [Sphingomicrobium sp.]
MRAILLILILAVVAVIIAVASGFLNPRQTRGAKAPDIAVSRNGVTASGGQTPAFEVETGTVSVGSQPANVTVPVPRLQVNPPAGQQPQAQPPVTNTAQ